MVGKYSLLDDVKKMSGSRVLCIGDVMMDRFVYGSIDRISPEAPIPVLRVEREKHMLGGAGNVVANLAALGAKAVLIAVTGQDSAGQDIQKQLEEMGVTAKLEPSADRMTTVKSRFVCGNQQMLRVDREKNSAIPADVEAKIIRHIEDSVPQVSVVILSDYNKGLLTDKIIRSAIDCANRHGKPIIVDPKGHDFTRYHGSTILTPNRKELETVTKMTADSDEAVCLAAMKLIETCHVKAVLATRSKEGMSLVSGVDNPLHIPAQVREVFDVSGAGDTVIASFAAAMAGGVAMQNAALIANIAAGIVVGKSGTATARPEEICTMIEQGLLTEKRLTSKLVNKAAAAEEAERQRARGKIVGFTNGCFDLLHLGHIASLRQAKENCDFLIVAINSDASVKRLKGESRPIQDEEARAGILSALEIVDRVVIFEEDSPYEFIKAIKPDVLVKGGQYKLEEVVGYDILQSYGGKIIRAEMEEGLSTTNTIAKMAS